jgi:cobalt-zinc-cadmium efflux system membrane fusion protein
MKTLITGAVVMVAAATAAAEVVRLDARQQSRAGIIVRPVLERSFGDQLRVVGQVVRSPGSTIMVKSIVAARVESIAVAPGDAVTRGQVLVELHSHEMLAMQSELLRVAERAKLADKRLEAGKELFAVDGISRLDLELREQEAFAGRLEFDTLRAELLDHGVPPAKLDQVLESKEPDPHLPIASPIDGVVLKLVVQTHEWVQEYEPLLEIGNPERTELDLQIAPDQATSVAAGDVVEFVPVGRPNATARATVLSRVPQVDPSTRTIRIRARITEDDPSLYPGVFVEGTLTQGSARMAPSVPASAPISVGGEDVVFVRRSADEFELRHVRLGMFNGTRYEVLDGVEPGEEVVVEGVFFLKSALVKGEEGES